MRAVFLGLLAALLLVNYATAQGRPTADKRPNVLCDTKGHESSPNVCQNFNRYVGGMVNHLINKKLSLSYVYMAMWSYFDRDDVAYHGFSKYFKKQSESRKSDAKELMEYMNKRGARVRYKNIRDPKTEWTGPIQALEDSMRHEKSIQDTVLDVHWEAQGKNDPHIQHFLEEEFLEKQVDLIKKLGDFYTQVKRFNNHPLGLHVFDQELQD